jgi:hypothetical protein
MARILPALAGVRFPAAGSAADRIGARPRAAETAGMDTDHTDIDAEDLPDLLAQLAAVALLELAARALVPAAAVWAG